MGGEGFFNLGLSGSGVVALESYVPIDIDQRKKVL